MSSANPARERYLVVQTAFVGDLLLATPLLRALRSRRPDGEIWLICRRGLGDFARRAGLADRVFEVDKSGKDSGWQRVRSECASASFEVVFSPHRSFRTAWFVRGLRARRKIGYRAWWNGFAFDERHDRAAALPDAMRQLALLSADDERLRAHLEAYAAGHAAGGLRGADDARRTLALEPPPDWASMEIDAFASARARRSEPSAGARAAATALAIRAGGSKQTLFIAPGSVWPTKRWAVERFAEVARVYGARGWNAVFFGALEERELCARAAAQAPGSRSAADLELPIFESCELLAMGDLLIANDSGAIHMAALSGLPTVAAFGPTTLDLGYRPWSASSAVAQIDLPCRPCGKHGSQRCPIGTHACMVDLPAADVIASADRLISL